MKIGFVWAIISFLSGCALTQERTNTKYKADEYSTEIARLETIILQNPKSSKRWPAHYQLAQLYISYNNPKRNYKKGLKNLKLYFPHHPASVNDHDLRNWLLVLKEIQNQSPQIRSQNKKIGSQNKKIKQLTAKLKKSRRSNLALKKANKTLAMKIDMLKTLDRRVEEKRKNYTSE